MNFIRIAGAVLAAAMLVACDEERKPDVTAEAPPPAQVLTAGDADIVKVDKPQQFPLVAATQIDEPGTLNVTGVVNPDVSRNIPVISLASGRVIEVNARLGDVVKKGQLLMRVQSDVISGAFAEHRTAVADERLASSQLDRAKLLFEKGAMAQKDFEIAQDADAKAKIAVENAAERIRMLGADVNHPTSVIDINSPAAGVITEQNVANSGGVKTLDNSPNLFTISDLSNVWIVCDVYETDLSHVKVGEHADIRLNAYPEMVFKGVVSDIGPTLDPTARTAKVRLEVHNPGMMRIGMFVSATFHGLTHETRAVVPAEAVLHLHDRDWVYMPEGKGSFRRVEVQAGPTIANNMQEIVAGVLPGDKVVSKALVLQNTADQ